jgi:hypothetical protein
LTRIAIALAALASIAGAKTKREAQLEDLAIARSGYVMKSRAFTTETRKKALALLDTLALRAGSIGDAEMQLAMMKLTALADNGHDFMDTPAGAWEPPLRLPLKLIWFPDALVVARAAPPVAELAGTRLTRIEGLSPDELLAKLRPLGGGTDAYRRWNLTWLIECGLLDGTLLDRLRVEAQLADGRKVQRTLALVPRAQVASVSPVRRWSPETPAAVVPLYLQEPELPYRFQDLASHDALYVQQRSNLDEKGALAKFVAELSKRIGERPPRNLIVDQRFNTGGNIDLTRELMRALVSRASGKVYVLVGRYTFSAGIVSAAAIKHDGGKRVTVVGEEIGDRLRWWSELDRTTLPNSHLVLTGTHGLWDLVRGCRDESGCYGDKYDATVGTLTPSIVAPLTAAAWLAGRDPALEAIAADLRRKE